jgi:tRNA (mo5U34)-methyltransferase
MVFQAMLRGSDEIAPVAEDYDFAERACFDAPGYPKLHFIERRYAHDPSNWWTPNRACAQAMLRSAGFDIVARPEAEVFLCRRGERPTTDGAVYPARGPLGRLA